jgi:hypothetical protein
MSLDSFEANHLGEGSVVDRFDIDFAQTSSSVSRLPDHAAISP